MYYILLADLIRAYISMAHIFLFEYFINLSNNKNDFYETSPSIFLLRNKRLEILPLGGIHHLSLDQSNPSKRFYFC